MLLFDTPDWVKYLRGVKPHRLQDFWVPWRNSWKRIVDGCVQGETWYGKKIIASPYRVYGVYGVSTYQMLLSTGRSDLLLWYNPTESWDQVAYAFPDTEEECDAYSAMGYKPLLFKILDMKKRTMYQMREEEFARAGYSSYEDAYLGWKSYYEDSIPRDVLVLTLDHIQ